MRLESNLLKERFFADFAKHFKLGLSEQGLRLYEEARGFAFKNRLSYSKQSLQQHCKYYSFHEPMPSGHEP